MREFPRAIRSYAKINLGLTILRKRPDGFHDIETIFQEIDLFDELEFFPMEAGVEIECTHRDVPVGPENICYKAVRLLQDQFGIQSGVRIKIKKQIPVGAGLGGGSSNAATVLKKLNQQWQLNLPDGKLAELGGILGSDVPFFIYGGSMLASGRGEILSPIFIPLSYKILLILPDFSVSTVWAYKNFKFHLTNTKKNIKLADINFADMSLDGLTGCLFNDLEQVVVLRYRQINELKDRLYEIGASYASMSGSGSAVFGLFSEAHQFSPTLTSYFSPNYQIRVVNPLRHTGLVTSA